MRGKIHTSAPVVSIRRTRDAVANHHAESVETFDHVVVACHSDEALALLDDANE